SQYGSLLGPRYEASEIQAFLDRTGAVYTRYDSETEIVEAVSELIATENVVGHMRGRMEFGPRALGNRSIIGDARSQKMQSIMNLKIKFRESFRPFAPCVLLEHAPEYFNLTCESPYMMLVAEVAENKRLPLTP